MFMLIIENTFVDIDFVVKIFKDVVMRTRDVF